MPNDASILSAFVTIAILFAGWAFRAFRNSAPKPDRYLDRIHAAFEGVDGKKVREVIYEAESPGGGIGGRQHLYVVTLEGPDGSVEKQSVTLAAGLFGPGAMTIGPPAAREK